MIKCSYSIWETTKSKRARISLVGKGTVERRERNNKDCYILRRIKYVNRVHLSILSFSISVLFSHVSSLTSNKRGTNWQICLFQFIVYILIPLDLGRFPYCCCALTSDVRQWQNKQIKQIKSLLNKQKTQTEPKMYIGLDAFGVKDNLNYM